MGGFQQEVDCQAILTKLLLLKKIELLQLDSIVDGKVANHHRQQIPGRSWPTGSSRRSGSGSSTGLERRQEARQGAQRRRVVPLTRPMAWTEAGAVRSYCVNGSNDNTGCDVIWLICSCSFLGVRNPFTTSTATTTHQFRILDDSDTWHVHCHASSECSVSFWGLLLNHGAIWILSYVLHPSWSPSKLRIVSEWLRVVVFKELEDEEKAIDALNGYEAAADESCKLTGLTLLLAHLPFCR